MGRVAGEAAPVLRHLSADEDADVRAEAKTALRNIDAAGRD